MTAKIINLLNPTSEDFEFNFGGEPVFVPAWQVVPMTEACGYDWAYYLAQRILQAKGKWFFWVDHDNCMAQLLGLQEPTFFNVASSKKVAIKTATGVKTRVVNELDENQLMEVEPQAEIYQPEDDAPSSDLVMVWDIGLGAVPTDVPASVTSLNKNKRVAEKVIEQEDNQTITVD